MFVLNVYFVCLFCMFVLYVIVKYVFVSAIGVIANVFAFFVSYTHSSIHHVGSTNRNDLNRRFQSNQTLKLTKNQLTGFLSIHVT